MKDRKNDNRQGGPSGSPTVAPQRLLYIHGFNSSPGSAKARMFADYCRQQLPDAEILVPALSYDPRAAMACLEAICDERGGVDLLVGSSLGGYYATWLAERYDCPAVLVNPAVAPHRHLSEAFLGWHKNQYTDQEYELTRADVAVIASFECRSLRNPDNYLLLVQTGDETLDYRLATAFYRDSRQIVQEGGDHSFQGFDQMLPEILSFAGLTRLNRP